MIIKLILISALGLFSLAACSRMEAVNKNANPNSSPSPAATKSLETPTPVKQTRDETNSPKLSAEDIKNGSVKADDYDENMNSAGTVKNQCDVEAFVIDKDYGGLNVRQSSNVNGTIAGNIPFNIKGTIVHLIGTDYNGWVKIDRARNLDGETVFQKEGYVAGNLLATSTTGYGTKGVKIYEAGAGSKLLTVIPPQEIVKVSSCSDHALRVKYKTFDGWLDPESQCSSPLRKCNQ